MLALPRNNDDYSLAVVAAVDDEALARREPGFGDGAQVRFGLVPRCEPPGFEIIPKRRGRGQACVGLDLVRLPENHAAVISSKPAIRQEFGDESGA
jgi:hypothetical protein